jgi:hypothetical protein
LHSPLYRTDLFPKQPICMRAGQIAVCLVCTHLSKPCASIDILVGSLRKARIAECSVGARTHWSIMQRTELWRHQAGTGSRAARNIAELIGFALLVGIACCAYTIHSNHRTNQSVNQLTNRSVGQVCAWGLCSSCDILQAPNFATDICWPMATHS